LVAGAEQIGVVVDEEDAAAAAEALDDRRVEEPAGVPGAGPEAVEEGDIVVDGDDRFGDRPLAVGSVDAPPLDRPGREQPAAGVVEAGLPAIELRAGDGEPGAAGVADVGADGLAVAAAQVLGEVGGQRQHALGAAIAVPAAALVADREVLADHLPSRGRGQPHP